MNEQQGGLGVAVDVGNTGTSLNSTTSAPGTARQLVVRKVWFEAVFATAVAASWYLLSGTAPYLSAAAATLLAARYGLRPLPRNVLPLLILLVPVSLFPLTATAATGNSLYGEGVAWGFGAAVGVRVVLRAFRRRGTSDVRFARVWLAGLLVAIVSAIWGLTLDLNGFTTPIRYLLVLASYVWGYDLVRSISSEPSPSSARIVRWLRMAVVVMGLLVVVDVVPVAHGVFLLAGLAASAAVRRSRRSSLSFPVALWPATVAVILVASFSLTLAGIGILSFVVSYLGQRVRPEGRAAGVSLAIALAVVMAAAVLYIALDQGSSEAQRIDRSAVTAEVETKLLHDRAPLWKASVQELSSYESLVRPAGQPLRIFGFPNRFLGYQDWVAGAHNILLEPALTGGIVFAGLIGGMLYIAIGSAGRFSIASQAPAWLVMTSSSAIAATIIGGLTGQFALQPAAGILIWLLLGLGGSTEWTHRAKYERGD